MVLALFMLPLIAGLGAFVIRPDVPRRILLAATALAHLTMTLIAWRHRPQQLSGDPMLGLDAIGLLFLVITSVLFAAAALYGLGYMAREQRTARLDFEEGTVFANAPEARFTGCLLLFLSMMTLVTLSRHFGLLWVAIEATTLASAPLIYFHRHHRSLEATWKYLLICSVGIALALLGNFFLAVAASGPDGHGASLLIGSLAHRGAGLNVLWLKAAFILLLVGYGTKMGLAPMHTWLPDAHSEAPSVVSALLSGALLNCAFLGLLRAQQVCVAAGLGDFGRQLLVALGLISMSVAAVFILGQTDFKRLLAYSSVEHVGILALGVGLGGAGTFGSMLHAVNHSLTKAMLFLVSGNILAAYGTKSVSGVRGLCRVLPVSGVLWITGFLAITGSPPFGPFVSELTILKAALDGGRGLVAGVYLLALTVIFIGMASAFLAMAYGDPAERTAIDRNRETWWSTLPPIGLAVLVLILGVCVPASLRIVLESAAGGLGGLR
jgi:hydrogenase-4 component F